MFTGLIIGLANLLSVQNHNVDTRLTFQPREPLSDIVQGESIAINGVCLSVESFTNTTFSVYASAETLRCTSLQSLSVGHSVNMERALRLSDRLGGHMVTGHVDTLGTVSAITKEGRSIVIAVRLPKAYMPHILSKGSIALDGISLTINTIENDTFSINCIPETAEVTTIKQWRVGTIINIETDIIGKYVLSHLSGMGFKHTTNTPQSKDSISVSFLQEHGFLS